MSGLTVSFFLFAIFFVWIWLLSLQDSVKFTTRYNINHLNSFSGSIVNLIIKSRFHLILQFCCFNLYCYYSSIVFPFCHLSELYWYTSFWLLLPFKYCTRDRFSFYNLCVTVVKGLYLYTLFWLLSLTFKYYTRDYFFLLQFICDCCRITSINKWKLNTKYCNLK